MTFEPNAEERALIEKGRRMLDEEKNLPPAPQSLLDKMQAQADAINFLLSPEGAKAREIMAMSQEEFEVKYPEVAFADAYDEEDEALANDPEADPTLLEDRTMEEKDAAAWERRHRRK